jgi:hypothetical protein
MANHGIRGYSATLGEFELPFLYGRSDPLTARFRVRVPVPEPLFEYKTVNHFESGRKECFKARYGALLVKLGYESDDCW